MVQCGLWASASFSPITATLMVRPISAVERAGMRSLNEGQKINYELVRDNRSGKMSADQLSAI